MSGKLLDEEDVLRLERGGYLPGASDKMKESTEKAAKVMDDELESEEARFEQELRQAQMDEAVDKTGKLLEVGETTRARHVQIEEVDDEYG